MATALEGEVTSLVSNFGILVAQIENDLWVFQASDLELIGVIGGASSVTLQGDGEASVKIWYVSDPGTIQCAFVYFDSSGKPTIELDLLDQI